MAPSYSDNINNLPLVSIILLNYNGKEYAKLWQSIFEQNYPNYEIIFIDNGSQDESLELFLSIARRYNVPVNVIRLRKNLGYSRANNIGVSIARGKYIVLLSNDIEVDKNWLSSMVDFLEKHPEVGVAEPIMFNYNKKSVYDLTYGYMNACGNIFSSIEIVPKEKLNEPFEVTFCEGASMFIRKDILMKTGYLFDEDYFMYYEDVDFCLRVRKLGYKCFVVPYSKIYHIRSGTTRKLKDPYYTTLFTSNKLLTLFRHLSTEKLIICMAFAILQEIFSSLILIILEKDIKNGLAVLKGIVRFFRLLPHHVKKRREIMLRRRCKDCDFLIPLHKSIPLLMKKLRRRN